MLLPSCSSSHLTEVRGQEDAAVQLLLIKGGQQRPVVLHFDIPDWSFSLISHFKTYSHTYREQRTPSRFPLVSASRRQRPPGGLVQHSHQQSQQVPDQRCHSRASRNVGSLVVFLFSIFVQISDLATRRSFEMRSSVEFNVSSELLTDGLE